MLKVRSAKGFTIVELLIVIVVIAVLAAISFVAYNGIQQRSRDSQRLQDVKTIAKAIDMYYLDNGKYPASHCGSSCPANKKINASWATTSDGTWSILESALVPKYISSLPKDPRASLSTPAAIQGGFNYDYVRLFANCDGVADEKYLLTYRLEAQPQKRDIIGKCDTNPLSDYVSSEYMVIK